MFFFIFGRLAELEQELIVRISLFVWHPSFCFVRLLGFAVCHCQYNSPDLGQGRVRLSVMCSWHPFHFLRRNICSGNQFRDRMFEQLLGKTHWKQVRRAFWARAVVACLRSAHARQYPWEPLGMSTVTCFHVGELFYLQATPEHFLRMMLMEDRLPSRNMWTCCQKRILKWSQNEMPEKWWNWCPWTFEHGLPQMRIAINPQNL